MSYIQLQLQRYIISSPGSLLNSRYLYIQLPTQHLHFMSGWHFKLNIVKTKLLIPPLTQICSCHSLPRLIKWQLHSPLFFSGQKPWSPVWLFFLSFLHPTHKQILLVLSLKYIRIYFSLTLQLTLGQATIIPCPYYCSNVLTGCSASTHAPPTLPLHFLFLKNQETF